MRLRTLAHMGTWVLYSLEHRRLPCCLCRMIHLKALLLREILLGEVLLATKLGLLLLFMLGSEKDVLKVGNLRVNLIVIGLKVLGEVGHVEGQRLVRHQLTRVILIVGFLDLVDLVARYDVRVDRQWLLLQLTWNAKV